MRRRVLISILLVIAATVLTLGVPLSIVSWRVVDDLMRSDLSSRLDSIAASIANQSGSSEIDLGQLEAAVPAGGRLEIRMAGRIDQSIGAPPADQALLRAAGDGRRRSAAAVRPGVVPARPSSGPRWRWSALAVLLSVVVGTGVALLTAGRLVTPLTDVARRAARLGSGRLPDLPSPIRHHRTGPGRRRPGLVRAGHRRADRPGARPGRRHLASAADPADRAAVAAGGTRRAPRPAGRRGGAGGAGADGPAGDRRRRPAGQCPVGTGRGGQRGGARSTNWPRSRPNGGHGWSRSGRTLTVRCPRDTMRARHPGPAAGGDRGAGGELAAARRRRRSASPCGRPPGARAAMVVLEVSDEGTGHSGGAGRARLRPGGVDGVIHRYRAGPGAGVHRGGRRPAGTAPGGAADLRDLPGRRSGAGGRRPRVDAGRCSRPG